MATFKENPLVDINGLSHYFPNLYEHKSSS